MRRPGASLSSLGSDLVVFGGDKAPAAVCHAPADGGEGGPAWQWFATGEAERPPARKGHAAAAAPDGSRLLVCGGLALEGEPSELMDVRSLVSKGTGWAWQAQGPAPQMHTRADGSQAPSERSGHCAVALGPHALLIFGGQQQGQLLQELCLLDSSDNVGSLGGPGRVRQHELSCMGRGEQSSWVLPYACPLPAGCARSISLPICRLHLRRNLLLKF